jgi:hypothetical protein
MIMSKAEEAELRGMLQNFVGGTALNTLQKLMENDLERIKISLIDLEGDPMLQAQGEARALRRALKYLTARPVTTSQV